MKLKIFLLIFALSALLIGMCGVGGASIIYFNNSSSSGYTVNTSLTNSSRDLSTSDLVNAWFYDSFSDGVISASYTKSGTIAEENGYLNISASAYLQKLLLFEDNQNVSIKLKVFKNGSSNWNIPLFIYWYAQTDPINYSAVQTYANNYTYVESYWIGDDFSGSPYIETNKYDWNTYKVNIAGNTHTFYRNGTNFASVTHNNYLNLRDQIDLSLRLTCSASIGWYDDIRYWQNNTGVIKTWQWIPANERAVNFTPIIKTDVGTTIWASYKRNSSADWSSFSQLVNNTADDIPAGYQAENGELQDIQIELRGDADNASFYIDGFLGTVALGDANCYQIDDTIYCDGANKWATLYYITEQINNASAISRSGDAYLLGANLYVNGTTTTLYINDSTCSWLKINSTGTDAKYLIYDGILNINNTKITSWDTTTLTPSISTVNRAYIKANTWTTPNFVCANSNLSYLGYDYFGRYGVSVQRNSDINNCTFSNNHMGLLTIGAVNTLVKNSFFHNNSHHGIYVYDSATNNLTIDNCTTRDNTKLGIELAETCRVKITNSTIKRNTVGGIAFGSESPSLIYNVDIINNSFSDLDYGIYMIYAKNVTISNNTFTNLTLDNDGWGAGVRVYIGNDNITIENNTINEAGTVGVQLRGNNTNTTIRDNYIDLVNISLKNFRDVNEIPSGIMIGPTYKGYGGMEEESWNDNWTALFYLRQPKDILISNNSFGSNVSVYLFDEGQNVTHDLSNYRLYNFSVPDFCPSTAIYINRSYQEQHGSTIYNMGNNLNRSTTAADISWLWTHSYINNIFQKRYREFVDSVNDRWRIWIDYSINDTFNIRAANWWIAINGTKGNDTNIPNPQDIRIYSPAYTPLKLNKNCTIYSNGTVAFQLWNDTLEPNWYSTVNASIVPSTTNVTVNITTWNTSGDYYKKFNVSSGNASEIVTIALGDFPVGQNITIKKNGTYYNTFTSNSTGYITFTYSGGFSDQQFEGNLSYSIDGYAIGNNNSLGLVSVTVSDNQSINSTTTSATGYYYLGQIYANGTYNISFSKTGFDTAYLEVTVNGANLTNQNKTIYDNTSPSQVTGLANDTPTLLTVNLTWTASTDSGSGIWGYRVFKNGSLSGYTQNLYYNITGLNPKVLYQFNVSANDTYNNWGANSTTINVLSAGANITGYVLNEYGIGISGVSVVDNQSLSSATSISTGFYSLGQNYANGIYNLTFSKGIYRTNYTIVTINDANVTNQNNTLYGLYTIIGYVKSYNGTVLDSAVVSDNQSAGSNTSHGGGLYSMPQNYTNSSYLFTFSLADYFTNTTTIIVNGANMSQNLTMYSTLAIITSDSISQTSVSATDRALVSVHLNIEDSRPYNTVYLNISQDSRNYTMLNKSNNVWEFEIYGSDLSYGSKTIRYWVADIDNNWVYANSTLTFSVGASSSGGHGGGQPPITPTPTPNVTATPTPTVIATPTPIISIPVYNVTYPSYPSELQVVINALKDFYNLSVPIGSYTFAVDNSNIASSIFIPLIFNDLLFVVHHSTVTVTGIRLWWIALLVTGYFVGLFIGMIRKPKIIRKKWYDQ